MLQVIRTTVLGGIVFLVPFVILVALTGKAYEIMLIVAKPVEQFIPIESFAGIAIINIITLLFIILLCFCAGVLAKTRYSKKVFNSVDNKLIMLIPGYAYIKSITTSLDAGGNNSLQPVMVMLDDVAQLAFKVEDLNEEYVVIYFPSAPDPRSGSVSVVERKRVKILDVDFTAAISSLRRLGVGSSAVIKPFMQNKVKES